MKTVVQIAERDIRQYLAENYPYEPEYIKETMDYDVYDVGIRDIFTKESKKLNRQLNIHKINKSKLLTKTNLK